MAALAGFLLIVVACLPRRSTPTTSRTPTRSQSTLDGTTIVDGKESPVLQQSTGGLGLGVTPIGPTWDVHHYFLGADDQGRDVAARLLYGGRNSLLIGVASALICCFFATIVALVAGFFGGSSTRSCRALLDVIWAFPVYLLAISLSIVRADAAGSPRPVTIGAGSLWLPIGIIGVDLRPVRRAPDPRPGAVAAREASSSRPRSASARPTGA